MREKLFDKLDSFIIPHPDDQKFLKNMAFFDFESICVQEDKFRHTKITTWISRHVALSVSTSSNLVEQPILVCNSNPGALVESIVDVVEELATQSKNQMKLKFLEIENSVKSKRNQIFSTLYQRRCCKKPVL